MNKINHIELPKRIYTVGSEWLYYKIYVGPQTSDYLLISILNPVTNDLLEKKIIDKWFFIRYADPENHIRVRFHLKKIEYISYIIRELYEKLEYYVKSKIIFDIQIGTYKRELERYGLYIMEEVESLFHFNSNLIIKIIEITFENSKNRWLLGMKAIDSLLNQWGYDLLSKKIFLEKLKNDFGEEFGVNKNIRKQLSLKFRNNKTAIESILKNSHNINEAKEPFDKFIKSNSIIIKKIIQKNEALNAMIDYDNLLKSLIHMHCNRLFKSNQRLNEWVVYDLLFRYYHSSFARNNFQLEK